MQINQNKAEQKSKTIKNKRTSRHNPTKISI